VHNVEAISKFARPKTIDIKPTKLPKTDFEIYNLRANTLAFPEEVVSK
jgi:hypothetical protein